MQYYTIAHRHLTIQVAILLKVQAQVNQELQCCHDIPSAQCGSRGESNLNQCAFSKGPGCADIFRRVVKNHKQAGVVTKACIDQYTPLPAATAPD